jgi:predicted DsbA family dithiol-disulfide isomerase
MFENYKKGGEFILVGKSHRFGQLVRDVIGTDSLHVAARKTGLNPNIISQMKNDHVPDAKKITQFVEGYDLNDRCAKELYDAGSELREDVSAETLLQMACSVAGLNTTQRLEILEAFRAARDAQESEQNAA